jgi:hypothetical protein
MVLYCNLLTNLLVYNVTSLFVYINDTSFVYDEIFSTPYIHGHTQWFEPYNQFFFFFLSYMLVLIYLMTFLRGKNIFSPYNEENWSMEK